MRNVQRGQQAEGPIAGRSLAYIELRPDEHFTIAVLRPLAAFDKGKFRMKRAFLLVWLLVPFLAQAADLTDEQHIERAVRDYIESQHQADPLRMARGIDPTLAKRTYWRAADGSEFIMNTDYDAMVKVAKNYNKDGTKFPAHPRVDIRILDIDQRVATVKLTADEWIDYMHLYKNDRSEWKIINVLWQYHDTTRQVSKK